MGAAGEVAGDTLGERGARRGDGRADGAARSLDHLRAPREADRALRRGVERSRRDRGDVAGIVNKAELGVARRLGLASLETVERSDALAQEAIFGAGET